MDFILYYLARGLIGFLQGLPLGMVARMGWAGGALAYFFDARHRRVAIENLRACFGSEKSPRAIRALARENFRRIGENYACAIKTASMKHEEIKRVVEVIGLEKLAGSPPKSRVLAIGHFGNFELFARGQVYLPQYQMMTTYRGLHQPRLNRLLRELREGSGCLLFERRAEAAALKAAMSKKRVLLGLLADQHAGTKGVRIHFLGRECSATVAPAVFALRYQCTLHAAICFRTAPGRWRIEISDEIPTHENGRMRPTEAITRDINRELEAAVRRDPSNWFWVHNRWKAVQRDK